MNSNNNSALNPPIVRFVSPRNQQSSRFNQNNNEHQMNNSRGNSRGRIYRRGLHNNNNNNNRRDYYQNRNNNHNNNRNIFSWNNHFVIDFCRLASWCVSMDELCLFDFIYSFVLKNNSKICYCHSWYLIFVSFCLFVFFCIFFRKYEITLSMIIRDIYMVI